LRRFQVTAGAQSQRTADLDLGRGLKIFCLAISARRGILMIVNPARKDTFKSAAAPAGARRFRYNFIHRRAPSLVRRFANAGISLLKAIPAFCRGCQFKSLLLLIYFRPEQKEQACRAEIDAQTFEEIWLCPTQARHG
jgi:hypothetical protein